ncbi:cationic amino acid transporter 2-like [Oppia nitens]|uniref:cationic amino acid transporter 2-like n=1 Tax=Oppia nitens TaxID=1686743 RepID=UPI0023DC8947|nr:cationic amino acid transporter 2-like [Oppia nitens]
MVNNKIFNALVRRKQIDVGQVDKSQLARVLSLFDLTCLGIGSTLGLGVYVLAGDVASRNSGPSVCISFLIAAIASVFAGLCYAEFGSRVPRAGSAYIYSYVTVGEFMAFVIGWNLILEYVIGTASVARGYSGYIDALFNGTIAEHFERWLPINMSGMSAYPDVLSFCLTILLAGLLAFGVKESVRLGTVMTCVNLLVVVFVIIAGCFHIDFHNWNISEKEIHELTVPNYKAHAGSGGFLPFGFSGMMSGAATCFYAFVGFDAIATTGEEAKNPKRAIPLSIVISLTLIFLSYFGVSAVQTLMLPYYMQSNEDTKGAPLPYIFDHIGWQWARWTVSIGALSGLSTSLLGAMFPLPRIMYAMASDGLIFRFLATVHQRSQTPLYATIIAGLFAGVMAALFNITELADMMSIGTLLAYTLVAESILIIR